MGKINVALTDETEAKFRKAIFENIGMKKGNISLALEEAIKLWINSEANKRAAEKSKDAQAKKQQQ